MSLVSYKDSNEDICICKLHTGTTVDENTCNTACNCLKVAVLSCCIPDDYDPSEAEILTS